MQERKVMIIEDDRFLSSVIKARLEKSGMKVSQAFDGNEALLSMKQDKPDLIILDLIMPKTTGFEVLEKIAATNDLKEMPVVVLSHLAQASDIAKAKSLGVKEYFVKVRVSIEEVINKVQELMGEDKID